jgi:hypothetical protein
MDGVNTWRVKEFPSSFGPDFATALGISVIRIPAGINKAPNKVALICVCYLIIQMQQ